MTPRGSSGNVNDFSNGHEDGDTTKRFKILLKEETATVKRIQFWVTLVVAIAGAGFTAAMFLSRYATGADLDKLGDKQQQTTATLQEHIVNETSRMSALEERSKAIEDDFHATERQLWRIADRVHAERVVAPHPPKGTDDEP